MQVYELGYLILPSIPEGELSGIVSKLKEIIAKAGGNIFDGEEPFKINLDYTMSKAIGANRYVVNGAYIGWIKFDLPPESAPAINEAVGELDEILRFILIKAPRETAFTFAQAKVLKKEEASEEKAEIISSEVIK